MSETITVTCAWIGDGYLASADVGCHTEGYFMDLQEYKKWEKLTYIKSPKQWRIKYYKGLGTSKPDETGEIFKDFDERLINYIWDNNDCIFFI